MVELVIAWNGKSMGKKIRIGQRPIFEKRVLTSLARKMPKNVCHSAMHPRFPLSSPFSFKLGLLGAAGVFPVFFLPCFWLLASFSHGWEVVFVVLGIGLSSSCFWSCWCIFHSCFWKFHVFLPWLWRAIHVFGCLTDCWSHAQAIWGIFPCYELCSLISFGTVCFPHVVSRFYCFIGAV